MNEQSEGPYGMPYQEFIERVCFHRWTQIPYRPEERVPIFAGRDKWQCVYCKRIVWSLDAPPPDLVFTERV